VIFTGVSVFSIICEDLKAFGLKLPESFSMDDWVAILREKPAESALLVSAISTLLFYLAERRHNKKVVDIFDALVYCTTCLSVGYGDIFAKTPIGKLIGSTLMTFGPPLAGGTLDGRRPPASATVSDRHIDMEILDTLKQILKTIEDRELEDR
jgi:hypothetical protein